MTRASPLVTSAFGQHRKFPPHARKTSDTQGSPCLVKFVKSHCKQKGVFHAFLDKRLRFKIITETISTNPALEKTFAFTIMKKKKIDCYRVVTMLMCIMRNAREGKRFVMSLS